MPKNPASLFYIKKEHLYAILASSKNPGNLRKTGIGTKAILSVCKPVISHSGTVIFHIPVLFYKPSALGGNAILNLHRKLLFNLKLKDK